MDILALQDHATKLNSSCWASIALVVVRLDVSYMNGQISLEVHGLAPLRGAPILSARQPESGNSDLESPGRPMWNDKIGMSFPGMQPFFGMLQKSSAVLFAIAL